MDELRLDIGVAAKRLAALVEITRWLWIVNAIVTIVAAIYGRVDIAALAGFTWVLALVAAAIGRRVTVYLGRAQQAIRS